MASGDIEFLLVSDTRVGLANSDSLVVLAVGDLRAHLPPSGQSSPLYLSTASSPVLTR